MPITNIVLPILNILYIYTIHLMIISLFDHEIEEDKKICIFRYAVSYILVAISTMILKIPILKLAFTTLAMFIISGNCYKNINKRIYATLFTYTVVIITEVISVTILGYVSIYITQSIKVKKITDLIIIYIFCFIAVILIVKSKNKIHFFEKHPKFFLNIVPILSIILVVFFYSLETKNIYQLSMMVILLLLINIVSYKMYEITIKTMTKEKESAVMEQQNTAYRNELKLIKASEKSIKSYRHDMKNHFLVLYDLIENDNKSGAKNYIKKMQDLIINDQKYVNSGNYAIDSIINYKFNMIKDTKIDIVTEISISEKINISDYDLTTIIGNLLDNAITASRKVEEKKRKIIIKIKEDDYKVIIYIQNAFDGNIKQKDGKFITTKEDNRFYGYGIQNIKKAVEKNNGFCKFKIVDKNIFTALIVLLP